MKLLALTTDDHIVLYKVYLISLLTHNFSQQATELFKKEIVRHLICLNSLHILQINAALPQKNVAVFMAFLRNTVWLKRS
jgi:hypothetical protein